MMEIVPWDKCNEKDEFHDHYLFLQRQESFAHHFFQSKYPGHTYPRRNRVKDTLLMSSAPYKELYFNCYLWIFYRSR